MSIYTDFTEKYEAIYAYMNAYVIQVGADTVNEPKLMLSDLKRDLVARLTNRNWSVEEIDDFYSTIVALLEINEHATQILDEDEELIGFEGISFKKDL